MTDLTPLDKIADAPLSVVLLAGAGQPPLDGILESWVRFLRNRLSPQASLQRDELILVHDGSSPTTADLLSRLSTANPLIAFQLHEAKEGVGRMLRTGLAQATRPLVLYAPCVPAYRPDLTRGLFAIIDQVHLVSGYRAALPVPPAWRWIGRVVRMLLGVLLGIWTQPLPGWLGWRGHLNRWLGRIFFGVHNLDVGCPLRLLRQEKLWRTPIQAHGSFAHIELLAKVNFLDGLIAEDVPLPVAPGQDGLPGSTLGQALKDALRVFQRPDFGPAFKPLPETVNTTEPPETAATPATPV